MRKYDTFRMQSEDSHSPDPPGLAMRRLALAGWSTDPRGRDVAAAHWAAIKNLSLADQASLRNQSEAIWGRRRRLEWARISRAVDHVAEASALHPEDHFELPE